jgi:hypothetical protein
MISVRSYYLINLPGAPFSSDVEMVEVVPSSSKTLRTSVERFARYFLREMHFGSIQFEAAETPDTLGFIPYKAFLFANQGRYIGAGCFRHREDQSHLRPWLLDWLWLHPFCRRQGNVTRAWPKLHNAMGEFRCAKPLSVSMERFLAKIGWQE